jgi:ribosomal protein S18 acetylase RimI-like enzyme
MDTGLTSQVSSPPELRRDELHVRALERKDVAAVVEIHLRSFQGFFLSQLGRRFLAELYRGFVTDSSAICLIALRGGEPQGFVAGTSDSERFFRSLLQKRWYAFVIAAIPGLVRHPLQVSRKLFSALFFRGDKPAALRNSALLSSIAVSPGANGRGIGRRLVEDFCSEAAARGCTSVYLTTDLDDNQLANDFYARCGFTVESVIKKSRDRRMNRYLRQIS